MRAFISDLCSRPSCAKCEFKGINRNSDFTLGDYWGIWNQDLSMDDNKGTSLVYVHSKKGREILEKIRNNIIIKKMNIDKSWEENTSGIYASELHQKFDLYYSEFLFVGTKDRIESEVVPQQGYEYIGLNVRGLVGNPIKKGIAAAIFVKSIFTAKKIVKKLKSFFHKIKSV